MKRLILILLLVPALSFAQKWECVEESWSGHNCYMERFYISHGWLIRGYGNGLTFIPDEKHEWKI